MRNEHQRATVWLCSHEFSPLCVAMSTQCFHLSSLSSLPEVSVALPRACDVSKGPPHFDKRTPLSLEWSHAAPVPTPQKSERCIDIRALTHNPMTEVNKIKYVRANAFRAPWRDDVLILTVK